jgi:hypothetical protein
MSLGLPEVNITLKGTTDVRSTHLQDTPTAVTLSRKPIHTIAPRSV